MTIPQQECREKSVPKCEQVSKEECKMVPKEKCTVVKGDIKPGQCRINTRLECQDRPKQKCGKKVMMITLFNQLGDALDTKHNFRFEHHVERSHRRNVLTGSARIAG